jgi:hypothetical protein
METEIAKQVSAQFPNMNVTEDVMSEESYWVNIRVGNRWLVIQKTANQGIGLSVVEDQSLDFGGHDRVVDNIGEAVAWAVKHLSELSNK